MLQVLCVSQKLRASKIFRDYNSKIWKVRLVFSKYNILERLSVKC